MKSLYDISTYRYGLRECVHVDNHACSPDNPGGRVATAVLQLSRVDLHGRPPKGVSRRQE